MERNSVISDIAGRSRYTGRDFDLYFFADENGKLITDMPNEQDTVYKMVASTNCSFTSNATYETIVDKSTPKAGVKELQSIDWSFQSDNNVASLADLKSLLKAHKEGTKIFVKLSHTENGCSSEVDKEGTTATWDDPFTFLEGFCVIQSCTLNAQDGSLATFSMTLEGSGDFEVRK